MTADGASGPEPLELDADVLVIGGGPTGAWAALMARRQGARVLLVDKGFCGASGVTAAATAGHWWVPEERREEQIQKVNEVGGNLSERSWMERVLEETWRLWPEIGDAIGYRGRRFAGHESRHGSGASGGPRRVQGPIYMREMRRRISHSGVRILDHAPALELLIDADGAVCGAAGVQRQKARPWRALTGAVVLATGGSCWRSGALGTNVDTGDGHLMAAEVGAALSGMEFSNYYGVVSAGSSMDKNGFFGQVIFTDEDGTVLASHFTPTTRADGPRNWLLEAALEGPVYGIFDVDSEEERATMRASSPNVFITFDRQGIDPFRQRFRIEYILEGLTRGTGGVRIVDETCFTGVPGLWAAGDLTTRELLAGASTGAGAPNASWTVCSGAWAGRGAAAHALCCAGRLAGRPAPRPVGRVGLRPSGARLGPGAWRELARAVQDEVLPPEKNGYRTAEKLVSSLTELDLAWQAAADGLAGEVGREQVWARETAAMLATARWAYRSALVRTESRGMHNRLDCPETDPQQRHRVLIAGVDEPQIWFERVPDPVVPYDEELLTSSI